VSLLRQPNFDAQFIDGLNGAVSDKALRNFHKLLFQDGLALKFCDGDKPID